MSFFEKASVILTGVNYSKTPLTDTPAFSYQTIHLKTNDGLHREGWYVPVANAKGTVILFHGHGGNRSGTVREGDAFHNFGYNVCMVDFRAHGNSEGNICTIGYKEMADVKAAYDYVKSTGETNIVLWGISLGAATITKALADYKDIKPSKVILEMPFGKLTDAVKGRLRIMHLPAQPMATLLTFWGGAEQVFWAFNHNPQDYATHINVPVLLQWGKNDQRVSEKEVDAVFNNIATKEKEFVVYNQSGHESLLKREPQKWLHAVGSFLDK